MFLCCAEGHRVAAEAPPTVAQRRPRRQSSDQHVGIFTERASGSPHSPEGRHDRDDRQDTPRRLRAHLRRLKDSISAGRISIDDAMDRPLFPRLVETRRGHWRPPLQDAVATSQVSSGRVAEMMAVVDKWGKSGEGEALRASEVFKEGSRCLGTSGDCSEWSGYASRFDSADEDEDE